MISRAVMPTRRSRTWVFLWIALFLMGILLQYGVALSRPDAALAASSLKAQTVQNFEVDGDLKGSNASVDAAACSAVQSGPGCIPDTEIAGGVPMTDGGDWLSVGATTVVNDGYNNPSDKWFDKGKELDTTDWSYKTSAVSPGKDDIRTAMGYGKFVNGDAYFYAGAERVITNGSTHVTFELDRKPFKTWANGVSKPDRSVGDVIIPIDFENGGVQPVVRIYKVTGVTDSANGQVVTVGPDISNTIDIRSAINFVDLPDQGGGGVNAVPAFGFAELSINLSAIGISTSCPGLANGFVRSRSGSDPFSSDLKDFVTPFDIDLNNCGKLRIEKHAGSNDGPLLGGAEFDITPNPIPGGTGTLHVVDNGANDGDGTAGEIEIDPAKPGHYTVCETKAPAGYKLPADPCHENDVPPNGTHTFMFADPPKVASTTLDLVQATPLDGSFVAVGDTITIRVREKNTGESILTNVHVTGTDSCPNWAAQADKNGGAGAFNGSLNPDESVDFTCSFDAPADNSFSWSALGHGTDEKGDAAPATNEDESGSYDILMPATKLTVDTDAPAKVHAGDSITIVVNEKNDGEGTISNVTVTGVKSCATWTPAQGFSGSLAAGASVKFSCTFNAPANDFTWEADGHATDALGHAVPSAGEHVQGNVDVVKPATELTLKSTVPAKVRAGDPVSIVVTEKNTGDGPLHDVTVVTEGGICAVWNAPGGFSGTLAAGASVDFTCTFNAPANGDDVDWSALGQGKDSLDAAAPDTGEHQSGHIAVIKPATSLSVKTAAPAKVHAGDPITIVVTEANTGDDALSSVHVDGGGSCATWVAAADKNDGDGLFIGALGAGESVDFTCSFNAPADGTDVTWSADGKATDSLGGPAPSAGEHQDGAIVVIKPATTLTLVSEVPDPILEGGTTVITVRETNTGDDTMTGVDVVNLDGSSDCPDWVASATKVGGGAFSGSLAPGQAVDFTCTVTAGDADVIWNGLGKGTDSLGAAAPATGEDEAGSVHVVNPNIDVVKTAGASLQSQVADGAVYETLDGSTVVYKYVVTTLDPDGLTAVQVSDDRCSPVTFVSGDTGSDGKLMPGESWIFQCSKALTIATDGAEVTNVVTASGQPALGGRVSETDDAIVDLRHPAVLIDKDEDDADDLVFPGQVVTYTLTLTVTGGPTDLVVTDNLPAGVTFESASDGGTEAAGVITWNLTNVADGTTELTYQVTVTAESGTLPNHAQACVPAFNGFEKACDGADDVVRVPGLHITKIVDDKDGVVAPGQTLHYTLEVTVIDGPFPDAVIVDTLPPGQTVLGNVTSDPQADATFEGVATVTWKYDSLPDGKTTLEFDAVVDDPATPGPQTNVAEVCASVEIGEETIEICDDDAVTVRVPTLTILKDLTSGNTAGSDPKLGPLAKVGDTLLYTLTYTLTDGPVTDAVITDPIKPGLKYVPDSASNGGVLVGADGSGFGGTVTWNLGTIEEDGTYTVTYKVTVLGTADEQTQPIVNVATIVSDETPPDDDDATVGVNPPPSVASPTPTLPSTDTSDTSGGTSGGSGLALILLLAVGILGGIGLLAPAPARRRSRDRD